MRFNILMLAGKIISRYILWLWQWNSLPASKYCIMISFSFCVIKKLIHFTGQEERNEIAFQKPWPLEHTRWNFG